MVRWRTTQCSIGALKNLKLSEDFDGKLRQIVPNPPGVRQHQFSLAPAMSGAGLA